jgi:hypothetical protein
LAKLNVIAWPRNSRLSAKKHEKALRRRVDCG